MSPGIESALKPQTVSAFDQYVALTEKRISAEIAENAPFVSNETGARGNVANAYAALRRGEVKIEKLETLDAGHRIDCPNGIIHHWTGVIFIPGATLDAALQLLQDYDRQSVIYAPEVEKSRTISRSGDDFHIFLRFRRKKVITVVLDTEHDVRYTRIDATHAASKSVSTSVREVADPGTARERDLAAGDGGGYLWRINAYWRFEQRDGGVYVRCESVSLTRDIPAGLGWLIGPFVTSIPRESLQFTLESTRKALTNK
ncbi:MAG TPA: hypothetical protein VFO34_10600 [Candidatus Acidoferrales bacterium]|nr:hypothetical protein [Candidatus Acidoferrales bacterium]